MSHKDKTFVSSCYLSKYQAPWTPWEQRVATFHCNYTNYPKAPKWAAPQQQIAQYEHCRRVERLDKSWSFAHHCLSSCTMEEWTCQHWHCWQKPDQQTHTWRSHYLCCWSWSPGWSSNERQLASYPPIPSYCSNSFLGWTIRWLTTWVTTDNKPGSCL